MNYPIIPVMSNNGMPLFIPDPAQVKTVYEQQLAINPSAAFPFWAKIWASAKALAVFLSRHPELVAGRSVLEIGAGIGWPSFSIAQQAATVIISDHNADAVALLEKNIVQLGLSNTTALCLDWNDFPATLTAEVVLLSDVNYAPDQFEKLLLLVERFLQNGSAIVLATPQRMMGGPFISSLLSYQQQAETISVAEGAEEVDVFVCVLMKGAD